MRMNGESECAGIWQTVDMTCILRIVNTLRRVNSRRVGSLWFTDVLTSASEIMERHLSGGRGEREREKETKT